MKENIVNFSHSKFFTNTPMQKHSHDKKVPVVFTRPLISKFLYNYVIQTERLNLGLNEIVCLK